jgi:hypothetical protein
LSAASVPAPAGHAAKLAHELTSPKYDVSKVCKAIAVTETSNCSDGTAKKRNNCHGIMQWDAKGNRSPKYYSSKEFSFRDCERIWSKFYGKVPDYSLAKKWTGNDSTTTWLTNFNAAYSSL